MSLAIKQSKGLCLCCLYLFIISIEKTFGTFSFSVCLLVRTHLLSVILITRTHVCGWQATSWIFVHIYHFLLTMRKLQSGDCMLLFITNPTPLPSCCLLLPPHQLVINPLWILILHSLHAQLIHLFRFHKLDFLFIRSKYCPRTNAPLSGTPTNLNNAQA